MKKILFLLLTFATVLSVSAQMTSPRFVDTAAGYNRTNAAKLNAFITATDAAGADTVDLKPQAMRTLVKIAAVDSVTFRFKSVSNSFYGDEVIIISTNSGTTPKLKLDTTNAAPASSGNITLASGLGAVWRFIFNGVKWVEASRAVQ